MFDVEEWRTPGGGEQGGEPDYAGYATCKLAAENWKLEEEHKAVVKRDTDQADLSITERVIFGGATGGVIGGGGGFALGTACPLIGNIVGGVAGAGIGIVTGVIGGGLSYYERWHSIEKTYQETMASIKRTYYAKIKACKRANRIPDDYE